MRDPVHPKLAECRIRTGAYASPDSYGNTGGFVIQGPNGRRLNVVASDGSEDDGSNHGWEHVSVSIDDKRARRGLTPNWYEMAFIKRIFWADDETVMQLHPAQEDHISVFHGALHLWRPLDEKIPLPPTWMV